MRQGQTLFAGALLAVLASVPVGAQSPKAPVFSSDVDLITVDAVVVDSKGQPVTGLTREDFVIKEGGVRRDIATFEAFVLDAPGAREPVPATAAVVASNTRPPGRPGRAFVVVVDDLTMSPPESKEIVAAITKFAREGLQDGDLLTLATTSGDAWWSASIPEGRDDLLAVAARLKGKYVTLPAGLDYMSEYEAFTIATHEGQTNGRVTQRVVDRWHRTMYCSSSAVRTVDEACVAMARNRATEINALRRQRTRSTLDAVRHASLSLISVRGRKSVLLFSRGFVDDPDARIREVAAASREANAAVYFIDTRGVVAQPGLPSVADVGGAPAPSEVGSIMIEYGALEAGGSTDLAQDTGGLSVRNTNDIGSAVNRVAAESRVFYLLGFYPPEGKGPGEWRKLKVEVARKGLTVRARRGYTLTAAIAREAPPKHAHPSVDRALEAPGEARGIPLRAMAYVMEPKEKNTSRVIVATELDASRLGFETLGDARTARLELSVTATHRDTGRTLRLDERVDMRLPAQQSAGWRSATRDLDLPPGVSQVRVVVRDAIANTLGAVTQRIEVPDPAVLHVSTPILTDKVDHGSDGQGQPSALLAVHREFSPGPLYCQFEVFGATRESGKARIVSAVELRAADGTVVRQSPPTPVAADEDGRVVRLVSLGLDGLADGAYDLVLMVNDEIGGGRIERHEPLTLARASES